MTGQLTKLEAKLGYGFASPALLEESVTHRSAAASNNERLEFLGDSILNFVIAAQLFARRPSDTEGVLSRLRASLVNRSSLAAIARELDLGAFIRLGGGELKSGGHRRESILADALEAVFGAVFLDGGYESARDLIERLYAERLAHLPTAAQLKDPKTRLQEHLQGFRRPLPSYEVLEVSGKAHDKVFTVRCCVEGAVATEGSAASRRQAEQQAAELMLERLQESAHGG